MRWWNVTILYIGIYEWFFVCVYLKTSEDYISKEGTLDEDNSWLYLLLLYFFNGFECSINFICYFHKKITKTGIFNLGMILVYFLLHNLFCCINPSMSERVDIKNKINSGNYNPWRFWTTWNSQIALILSNNSLTNKTCFSI